MHFVIIFGPPAVGKMSVGRELENLTGLKLFHNHMTIELLLPFFEFGTPSFMRLLDNFREEIFKEVAIGNSKGIIFTYLWAFHDKSEEKYIKHISKIFERRGGKVCYVELEADLKQRIKRNKTSERLEHKPSKRDIKRSQKFLLEDEETAIRNSALGQFPFNNYLRINNTNLSAKSAAKMIKKKFGL